jgi:Poly(ADP-ribose) polymerase and DNA-Ligase Zn-finger region
MAHIIEEAKSGRAGCRTCRKPIAKGELRFGEEVENQFADGGETTYRWHHMACAAGSKTDELRVTLAAHEGTPPVADELKAELERLMSEADAKKPPPYPHADKAPSGRAKCQGCGETIAKGELRVAFERDIERGMSVMKGAGYLHPKCAAGYIEENGGTHADLTEALRTNTRDLSEQEMEQLFAEV